MFFSDVYHNPSLFFAFRKPVSTSPRPAKHIKTLPSDAWDAWEQIGRLGKVLTKLGSLLVYQIARSILHGYFNPNESFGISGNIYGHQQRNYFFAGYLRLAMQIGGFLQNIWLYNGKSHL
jgi:hypothetical protein